MNESGSENVILAPNSGIITQVFVVADQIVEFGQPLLELECMKMLINVEAPVAGKVQLMCDRAQTIAEGELLGWIS